MSKTLIFAYFAKFLPIFGQFSGTSGPFWSSKITKDEVKRNNNHLKWLPGETNKSSLIKWSKTLIFAYFAYFLAIFDPFGGSNHQDLKFLVFSTWILITLTKISPNGKTFEREKKSKNEKNEKKELFWPFLAIFGVKSPKCKIYGILS